MLIGDKVCLENLWSTASSSVGQSLRLKMTPPQNCRDWQRWMPPSEGGVVFAGGFHHGPDAIPSCPQALAKWIPWLSFFQSHWTFPRRHLGNAVSAILVQLFLPEYAPLNNLGVTRGGFSLDLPVSVSGGRDTSHRGAYIEGPEI